MINKLKKYYHYIERFITSPRKAKNVKELLSEIRGKGLVTGIQSVLHMKSGGYTPDFTQPSFNGTQSLTKEFDKSVKITLPLCSQPVVSIIIPTYNQIDYTYNCVRSIYEHTTFTEYEIIIADDNSPESTAILQTQFENLKIVKNATNLGFLKNCNNAAKTAKGQYIVFLNNDTQVLDNWLSELLFIFANFLKAGLVGS